MECFMCGLDSRVVKLTTVKVSDTKSGTRGAAQPGSKTVCEHCKVLLIAGNHPDNQNLTESPSQPGYMKPSGNEENPSVRPQ